MHIRTKYTLFINSLIDGICGDSFDCYMLTKAKQRESLRDLRNFHGLFA